MDKRVIALVGENNSGKTTVFGEIACVYINKGIYKKALLEGEYCYKFNNYEIVDIPCDDTFNYILNNDYDCVVVVCNATKLCQGLNFVLKVLEVTNKVVLLLNFNDKVKKKNMYINAKKLKCLLGVPVVKSTAKSGFGINALLEQIDIVCSKCCENIIAPNRFKKTLIPQDIELIYYQVVSFLPENKKFKKIGVLFAFTVLILLLCIITIFSIYK